VGGDVFSTFEIQRIVVKHKEVEMMIAVEELCPKSKNSESEQQKCYHRSYSEAFLNQNTHRLIDERTPSKNENEVYLL